MTERSTSRKNTHHFQESVSDSCVPKLDSLDGQALLTTSGHKSKCVRDAASTGAPSGTSSKRLCTGAARAADASSISASDSESSLARLTARSWHERTEDPMRARPKGEANGPKRTQKDQGKARPRKPTTGTALHTQALPT